MSRSLAMMLFASMLVLLSILSMPSVSADTQADICFVFYGEGGNLEYPWASATRLTITFDPTVRTDPAFGSYFNVTGLVSASTNQRIYYDRYGHAIATPVTALASIGDDFADNKLFLTLPTNIDGNGISYYLSTAIQFPGRGPTSLLNEVNIYTDSLGNLVESPSFIVDETKTGVYASASLTSLGFVEHPSSVTGPGTSATNCVAAITALPLPTLPNPHTPVKSYIYNYFISDSTHYSVTANLTLTTTGTILTDGCTNYYDVVTNIVGTRSYLYVPTGITTSVTVSGPTTDPSFFAADQRVYPVVDGAIDVNPTGTIPVDYDGILYSTSSPVAKDGLPTVSVSVVNPYWYGSESESQLEEGKPRYYPLPELMQQYFHSA